MIEKEQYGGKKGRSTKDNWLIMAIIDENKKLGKDTYMIFADAEKCFDKLWLEDCLNKNEQSWFKGKGDYVIKGNE